MPINNTHHLAVDLKLKNEIKMPQVTMNDDVIFIMTVTDDGQPVVLDENQLFLMASVLPNRKSIQSDGEYVSENQISFKVKKSALSVTGKVTAAVGIYEGGNRISTMPFSYEVVDDKAASYVPAVEEIPIIQLVFGQAPFILNAAELATQAADIAASNADEKADLANTATTNANNAASNADEKADLANAAAENADTSTSNANAAAGSASAEALKAKNQTDAQVGQMNEARDLIDYINNEFLPDIDQKYEQVEADIRNSAPKGKIYGVYWDKTFSPILTRIKDAFGMVAGVGAGGELVRNDFDTAEIYKEIGERTDSLGNTFIWIPKFYIKKTDGLDFKTIEISKQRYAGFYRPACFWDVENGVELEGIWVGKYRASQGADNRLESKRNRYPLVSRNIVQFRDYARLNNVNGLSGYQQYDIHIHDVIATLFYVEFATLDSQSVMSGFSAGQYTTSHVAALAEVQTNRFVLATAFADAYRVNQSIGIGTSLGGNQITGYRTITAIEVVDDLNKAIVFDGDPLDIAVDNIIYNTGYKTGFSKDIAASSGSLVSNTDGKHACMYRGIESPWGDIWSFVDGVNINEYQAWVAKDAGQYASNLFAAPYEQLGYINSAESGYTKYMGWDEDRPFVELPVEIGAGSSTYYSDYYYRNTGQRVLVVGGYWYAGADAGLSSWYAYYSSGAASLTLGGRLCLKSPS